MNIRNRLERLAASVAAACLLLITGNVSSADLPAKRVTLVLASTPGGLIVGQAPATSALVAKGSSVGVDVAAPSTVRTPSVAVSNNRTAAAEIVGPPQLSVEPHKPAKLQLTLRSAANMTVRFLGPDGETLGSRSLGLLHSGANRLAIKLPAGMNAPGRYTVVLSAGSGRKAVSLALQLDVHKF